MICAPELVSEMFRRARQIRALLFDVDGVFTDGKIIYTTDGKEIKQYDAHDGLGIKMAQTADLLTGIISARESEAIRIRAADLKIDILYLGRYDKLNAYHDFQKTYQLKDEEICFVGDDLPDIPVLLAVGFPVAVENASEPVKQAARFVTKYPGGQGAIREVVEFILHAQQKREQVIKQLSNLHQSVSTIDDEE